MTFGKFLFSVSLLGLGLAGAAVYSPENAERVYPGLGAKAVQLRGFIPEDYRAKLPPSALAVAEGKEAKAVDAPKPAPPQRPPVTVVTVEVKKGPLAVRLDTIGTIQTVANVAVRTRADAQIDQIFVPDGAAVKAGDLLVKLDSRQIEAQIKQAEATLAKDQAALEQANRDVVRIGDLLSKGTGLQISLDTAKTAQATARALILGDEAAISNFKVQLTWYSISAPISGRVGTFGVKAGNIIRSGDNSATGTFATINQITPIYVAFSLPQSQLPELRAAMAGEGAKAVATPQGLKTGVEGKVAVLDNSIDATTGTITARAIFDNPDETLWPGQLCSVRVTLRTEPNAVFVPREAVQSGQNGTFVFLVADGAARIKPVKVARVQDGLSVIAEGLSGGEQVVIDGASQLTNNAKVEIRNKDARKPADGEAKKSPEADAKKASDAKVN